MGVEWLRRQDFMPDAPTRAAMAGFHWKTQIIGPESDTTEEREKREVSSTGEPVPAAEEKQPPHT